MSPQGGDHDLSLVFAVPETATQGGARRSRHVRSRTQCDREIAQGARFHTNRIDQIYGEHEVGGTGFIYLSSVPFEQIGFRTDLGNLAYPLLTQDFLYGVPIVLTLWPAFLLARSNATKPKTASDETGA